MQVISDHTGKTSQARVSALVGMAIAGGLAFTQPDVEWETFSRSSSPVPAASRLWQKGVAPMERGGEVGGGHGAR